MDTPEKSLVQVGAAVSPHRRRSRAPAVGQRHPPNHPQPGGRGRHRGPGIRSQSPGWGRAIAGRRRGLDCRDADGGQVAVTGDAGPLCTGPAGSTGRRRSRPLRSRIKPGSTTPPSSRRRGVDLAGNDGTSSSTSGGSGWVSCARRSSWGLTDLVGNGVGRGAPWGHVQSVGGPCIGVSPYSGLYVISPKKIGSHGRPDMLSSAAPSRHGQFIHNI